MIWAPSSLLPRNGVKWEAPDDVSARAKIRVGEETIKLNLSIESDGRLREIRMFRLANLTEDGSFGYIPFGGQMKEKGPLEDIRSHRRSASVGAQARITISSSFGRG